MDQVGVRLNSREAKIRMVFLVDLQRKWQPRLLKFGFCLLVSGVGTSLDALLHACVVVCIIRMHKTAQKLCKGGNQCNTETLSM